MNDLSRRHLLAGAAAVGAATALAPLGALTARAAVPPAAAQAPGFYRYKVGAYECTSINDGARSFPMPDTFVDQRSRRKRRLRPPKPPICRRAWSRCRSTRS